MSVSVFVSLTLSLFLSTADSGAQVADESLVIPDTLDSQVRVRARRIWQQLKEIDRQRERAWEKALADDPLLHRAVQEKQKASLDHLHSQNFLFGRIADLQERNPEVAGEIESWRDVSGSVYADGKLQQELAEDESIRSYVAWNARFRFSRVAYDDLPAKVKNVLSRTELPVSAARALEVWLAVARVQHEKNGFLDRQATLEAKLANLDLPSKELRQYRRAYCVNELLKRYIRENRPEYEAQAREEGQTLRNELTSLWPGWRKAAERKEN